MTDDGRQIFNDDLLLGSQDQANARTAFPRIFHILDHEELRAAFSDIDKAANREKRGSHWWGISSVLCVVAGLSVTSGEPVYAAWWPSIASSIAFGGAAVALGGGIFGLFGIVSGPKKRRWLGLRMVGERLRQFHFQDFVCHTDGILASLKGGYEQQHFMTTRQIRLIEFKSRFLQHIEAELNSLLPWGGGSNIWIDRPPLEVDESQLTALPEEFFDAYRTVRILHQRQYAEWKLRSARLPNLRTLAAALWYGSVSAALVLIATECSIVFGFLHSGATAPKWPHWLGVTCAVIALGMRTLEEGLQPRRELERYQSYRSRVGDTLDRFDSGSRREKFEAMIDLEQLSFEEMRDFIRTSQEARFIM